MSTLKLKAQSILDEKNNKIKPENIKAGIQVFDVVGVLQEGINTDDATARGYDMAEGKTAYVGGKKIEGTLHVVNSQLASEGDLNYEVFEYTDKGTGELLRDEYFSVRYYNNERQIFSETSSINLTVQPEDVASAINLTASQIQAGSTILGINGTAPVTFATIEEMESNTNFAENTLAIVYGTEYVGTYKLDAGVWTQIGEATSGVEMMNVLNLVDENIEEYEGNGGTDEEINAVLEDILTNPNTTNEPEIPENSIILEPSTGPFASIMFTEVDTQPIPSARIIAESTDATTMEVYLDEGWSGSLTLRQSDEVKQYGVNKGTTSNGTVVYGEYFEDMDQSSYYWTHEDGIQAEFSTTWFDDRIIEFVENITITLR